MSDHATTRLQKFLADAGICSRRAAETLIADGEVWVNGQPATLGQKITPDVDKITVRGKNVRTVAQPKLTLAMHKPRGLVCSNDDPHNPETVFDLLPREMARHRFFCAGRLDKDSEGLLILTTDGDLANRLMHPSTVVVKRYHVVLAEPFPAKRLGALLRGVTIEGERLKVEYAALVNPNAAELSTSLDVHLHHGKKREIRQLFMALGFEVRRLRRYQIGAFPLRGIPVRAMKLLTPREIATLFAQPGIQPAATTRRYGRPQARNAVSQKKLQSSRQS
ncbi:pseudouridine synthase [Geminisphaera colitermitum]|uniref:pseudouridine synthase n=1 Tax=Geminisphaera colitermitum TaxID=1148786 RepID=UPI000158D1D5|nr:pseudouridine synthase [Geminisphaera colitermitum]